MPSWWDSLFGDVPQPARPTGYAAMPDAQTVEDRRAPGANAFPSRPHDLNWQSRTAYNPLGTRSYDHDAYLWLQSHMPAKAPTTPMQDSASVEDPGIVAQIKAAQARWRPKASDFWANDPNLPTPMPSPDPQRGPQFTSGLTLNSLPWGL